MPIEHAEQAVHPTDPGRKTRILPDEQLDELGDLRLEAIAVARLAGFDHGRGVPHADIMAAFGNAG